MPKSNDNSVMDVSSRLQIEQINSQSSHADTAEENCRLVLANYPMKKLVRENVERFCDVNVILETETTADDSMTCQQYSTIDKRTVTIGIRATTRTLGVF